MTPVVVEELVVPATIDAPDAADFVESVELRSLVEALGDGDRVAWAAVEVLPGFRRRGIGTAIADRLERIARDDRRERLLVYVVSPDGAGERLAASTGFGSVPRANAEVRFLLARGYALEQVERASRLPLPLDDGALGAAAAAASAHSGPGYALHSWTGATPERWLADLAVLYTRMSTDAPSAGLDEPEDVWTAERVRAEDAREAASPRTPVTAAVEHVATGTLVGFTVLSVPPDIDRSVGQYDTLVLREHRGHGLGALLKLANLVALQRRHPGHPSVITFNAEENRPMLRVNEAIGSVPIGYEGAWRKNLS